MIKVRLVFVMLLAATWLAAQPPAPTLENATPLTATDWVAWNGYNPTRVHLLRVAQPPEDWGTVDFSPSDAVRGRREVVLVGENHVALRPYPGEGSLTTINLPGYWSKVVATAAGFVVTDGNSALAFSVDGRRWEQVDAPMLKDGTLLTLTAGDGKFVMLVDRRIEEESGTPWRAGDIWTSTDGRNWRNTYFGETVLENRPFEKLAYQNKQWVAMGRYNALVSNDGENWRAMASELEEIAYTTGPAVEISDFSAGGGRWWAWDWEDHVLSSSDGVDWTQATRRDLNDFGLIKGRWAFGPQGLVLLTLESDGKLAVDDFDGAVAREEALAERRFKAEQEARRLAEEKAAAENAAAEKRAALAKVEQEKKFYSDWAASEARVVAAKDMTELAGNLAKHIELLQSGPIDKKTKEDLLAGAMDFVVRFTGARGAANFSRYLRGENLKRWNEKVSTYNQQTRTWLKEAWSEVVGGQRLPANWSGNQGWPVRSREETKPATADFMDVTRVRRNLASGHAGAVYDLSLMYVDGLSVPQDKVMQLFWVRVLLAMLPDFLELKGADSLQQLVDVGSAIENARQAALIIHNNKGRIDARATRFLLSASEAGAKLALPVVMRKGTSQERLVAINDFIGKHLDRANPPLPLTSLPVGNGVFELKYPPISPGWKDEQTQQWRAAFERHHALSTAIFDLAESLNGDTDLPTALEQIGMKHREAWAEPLPKELEQAYSGGTGAALMLMDRSADFHSDALQNIMAWVEMMVHLDGDNPERWYHHARLLYWSGKPDEAGRAIRMADALLTHQSVGSLTRKAIGRLRAELALPAEVRDVPQQGVADYNMNTVGEASLLGKDYTEQQTKNALAVYRNFGRRLAAAWSRPDAATVLPLVYQAHASEVEYIRYPKEHMAAVEREYTRIQELQKKDAKAALASLEKLAAEAPLAGLVRLRAAILLELDRLDEAMADIDGALLMDGKNTFAGRLKTAVQQRLEDRAKRDAKERSGRLDGLLADAKQTFRQGDAAAGKAKLDAILKEGPDHVGSLLLLAAWQETNAPASLVDTLNKAVAADRNSDLAMARLIVALAQQRKLAEAQQFAQQATKDFPRSGVVAAADTMVKVFAMMLARQAPIEIARNSLPTLETAVARAPDEPLPYAVRAQLNMILGDRAAAAADMVRVVERSDYLPAAGLNQMIALLEQQGMSAEAAAIRTRLPKN